MRAARCAADAIMAVVMEEMMLWMIYMPYGLFQLSCSLFNIYAARDPSIHPSSPVQSSSIHAIIPHPPLPPSLNNITRSNAVQGASQMLQASLQHRRAYRIEAYTTA
jgi:hypothetical protein